MPVRQRSGDPARRRPLDALRASNGERSRGVRRASHAFAAYLAVTIAATWPLVLGLDRDVAWDLGDSLLNMWILAWDAEQLLAILSGDAGRILTFFDANMFHPAPLTLAYSEHLLAQAVQIFPVYAISGNPILCYNLLFLSTFVLSGLGTYLLVRELTGNAAAAFVAGLLFAFAPYRLAQSSHLQVLSSQWMPFALYGLRRYFETGRLRPLGGGVLALVAQNLSCGYYLLFFNPFVAAYVVWELWRLRLWRSGRTWAQLSVAGVVVIAATAPLLLPYAAIREQASRSRAEVSHYSADVYSYATAFPGQTVWGRVAQALPKPEGELFPGAVPVLLALVGIVAWRRSDRAHAAGDVAGPSSKSRGLRWLVPVLTAAAAAHALVAAAMLPLRRVTFDTGLFVLRITDINQLLLRAAGALALVLALSPAARARVAAFLRERGFFVVALLAALWLSLGPTPQALGRPLELAAPYAVLFEHVPGFQGVRVPARFAMIGALMLAVLGGYGAAVVAQRRGGRGLLAAIAAIFLLEATVVPFMVNRMTPPRDFNAPEARIYRPGRAPAVYREFARRAPEGVLAELPLGYPDFDLRAIYYSIVHWRPLVNGYSGFFPPHYGQLASAVADVPRHPTLSLQVLQATGATHVIVHEWAYRGPEGAGTSAAFLRLGAVELFRDGGDVLLALPPDT